MATDEFITNAEAQRHIEAVKGAFNISGTFNSAWMEEELESIRGEIWEAISEYDIYDAGGDLSYNVISSAPLSLAILRALCVDLLRYRAYLSSKGAMVPEAIQKRYDEVKQILKKHEIYLPDIDKKSSTAGGGKGQVYISKNTPRFDTDKLKDW